LFIERILKNDDKRDPSLKKTYVYLKFSCDECGKIYEKKPGNVSKTKSGLTFCGRKCRNLSCSKKGKGLMKFITEKTVYEIYGVKHVMSIDDVKRKRKELFIERYGADVKQAPGTNEKRKRTNFERYGFEETFQCKEFVEKRAATWLENYGVPYHPFPENAYMLTQQSMTNYPEKWASREEIKFKDILIEKFGKANIIHQKWINNWPIDFYIVSTNTYIQFDGVYWHGLDTPIEKLSTLTGIRNKARYAKFLADQKQNAWFKENNLNLIRLTDVQFKELGRNIITLLS
jgi:hypothetical protein